jgi:hypothetical protein
MTKITKIINSNTAFAVLVALFFVIVGIASVVRQGNDIKVDIYGAEEVQAGRSPYYNPHQPERTIYRCAPPFALMMYPFLAVNKLFGVELSRADFSAAFNYNNITLTIIAFYTAKALMFVATLYMLLGLFPPKDRQRSIVNLKIAFLLSSPFIAYELVNNQNKLMALFFLMLALFFFERSRPWLSGIFFNMAMVIYIPLAVFMLYFLRYKKSYILMFLAGALVVFILLPSLIIGFDRASQLTLEWYQRCLKPFFFSGAYSEFMIELRKNSQSLPSAVGRMFCSRMPDGSLNYRISPQSIGLIIKILSALLVLSSMLGIWFSSKKAAGLQVSALLLLSLLLPSYCLVYTWAYLAVVYFYMLDYVDNRRSGDIVKRLFLWSGAAIFAATVLMAVEATFYISLICWVTAVLCACLVFAMFKERFEKA